MHPSTKRLVHVHPDDPRWVAFLSAAQPTLFQSPDWAKLIEEVYGFSPRVAMVIRDGAILGGLPYAEVNDFRGARRIAYPFADVCEPLGEVWSDVERSLCDEGIAWQIRSRIPPTSRIASFRQAALHHSIDLPASVAEAEARCHPKQRANVKQARNAGLTHRTIADESAAELFYAMHSRVRKEKHRLLPQPRSFFQAMCSRFFPDRGFLSVAELEGEPVAAMVFLACQDTLYYKFSASDLDALSLRPNHFLLWKSIEAAIERRYSAIDLGISDAQGLVRFKERLGAVASPVFAATYLQPEKSKAVEDVERALSRLTNALTESDVPLSAAQAAGDALYRFFA